mmetsp:Transcript_90029/g.275599  ORF Transcript_90029/g.275599 Transcript_90029/m.275599 type:complete len:618 (-) Transcript_90029:177-2030(-)
MRVGFAELLGDLLQLVVVQDQLGHQLADAVPGAPAPVDRARHGRHVVVQRGVVGDLVDLLPILQELLLDVLQVLVVLPDDDLVLRLELGLDEGPFGESLEVVEEFQPQLHGVLVVERGSEQAAHPHVEALHRRAEGEIVGVELLLVDVEDVVAHGAELVHGSVKLLVDRAHAGGQRLALGAAHVDALQPGVLHDRLREVKRVSAALPKRVQPHKQSVVLHLPSVASLGGRDVPVQHVRVLEGRAHLQRLVKLLVAFRRLLRRDHAENVRPADKLHGLRDDRITNFADKHGETGRSVVKLGITPNHEDPMQNPFEGFVEGLELDGVRCELADGLLQRRQELYVVVGLLAGLLNLSLQPGEGHGVRALVRLQELQDLLQAVHTELGMDRIQVVGLALPELDLRRGLRVLAVPQHHIGILLEDVADLLRPRDDRALENVDAVLAGGELCDAAARLRVAARGQGLPRWLGQQSLPLGQAARDMHLRKEHVVFAHDVLPDEIRPAALVGGVHQRGHVNGLAINVQLLHHVLCQLQENDGVSDVVLRDFAVRPQSVHDDDFLAHLLLGGQFVCAGRGGLVVRVEENEAALAIFHELGDRPRATGLCVHGRRHVLLHLLRLLAE